MPIKKTPDEIFDNEINSAFGFLLANRHRTNAELRVYRVKTTRMVRAAARKRYDPPLVERRLTDEE